MARSVFPRSRSLKIAARMARSAIRGRPPTGPLSLATCSPRVILSLRIYRRISVISSGIIAMENGAIDQDVQISRSGRYFLTVHFSFDWGGALAGIGFSASTGSSVYSGTPRFERSAALYSRRTCFSLRR